MGDKFASTQIQAYSAWGLPGEARSLQENLAQLKTLITCCVPDPVQVNMGVNQGRIGYVQ